MLMFALAPGSRAADDLPPLDSLVEQALAAHLDSARYWHILLHYEPALTGGVVSQVDDPAFFLAASGRREPRAELVATVEALFGRLPADEQQALLCRFPARYAWLRTQLHLLDSPLPECERFNGMLSRLQPASVALVFPDAYMNSPASMFGHTLLLINGAEDSQLLARSVNYSARTTESRGLVFAAKGLFGFYNGYYEFHPYYIRVQQYSDISMRDIWEYPLNLTDDEVLRLVRHVWELQEVYTRYYFFDDNCSYNLLHLLEAARPAARLTEHFRLYAIPLDTIRAVDAAGLIAGRVYRPSRATTLRALAADLSAVEAATAVAVAAGTEDVSAITGEQRAQAHALELATALLKRDYADRTIEQATYRQRLLTFLRARSKLGSQQQARIPEPPPPDAGHRSGRIGVGVDVVDDRLYQSLSLRIAYHGLLDPTIGSATGAEIEFGHLQLHVDPTDEKLMLDRLTAIGIVSIDARDRFFKPLSWKVAIGIDHRRGRDRDRHHLGFLNTGRGLAARLGPGTAYAFAELDLLVGGALTENHAAGAGGTVGWLAARGDGALHLHATALTYALGDTHDRLALAAEGRWSLSPNLTVRAGVRRELAAGNAHNIVSLAVHRFW
jgi:hypothetical protein